MKDVIERSAWMNKYKDSPTIPLGEGRQFTEDGPVHTPDMWVNSHLHRKETSAIEREDVEALGEFTCKLIWIVNCKYGVLDNENGKDTYTNALCDVLGV